MRSFPWRPFPFRRGNGKETIGPIEVPIHGFLANPIPVGMVTPARPHAEAAQGAGVLSMESVLSLVSPSDNAGA